MSRTRDLFTDLLPPVLRRSLRPPAVTFRLGFDSWDAATKESNGYDVDAIADRVLDATKAVLEGRSSFERDGTNFAEVQYSFPAITGLLCAAIQGSHKVMDFGGGLGGTFLAYRAMLPSQTTWGVVEQHSYVHLGREQIRVGQLHFFNTIEECSKTIDPDIVLLSSVLQYLEDPIKVLEEVSSLPSVRWIVIDRTSCSGSSDSLVAVQTVHPPLGKASYPVWFLSELDIQRTLGQDFHLVTAFDSFERWQIGRRSFQNRGWIYSRRV
jgi:putative methyltransferase (TIGR04325 family)